MSEGERLGDEDYRRLLAFRTQLRSFLSWSEQAAEKAGLTPALHQLLLAVRGHRGPRPPTVGDAAAALHIRHHSAVELAQRAEAAGLLTRDRDASDRRRMRLALTAAGEQRLESLTRAHLPQIASLAGALQGARASTASPGGRSASAATSLGVVSSAIPTDLSGRVVAITGASSGIGEALALVCANAGAAVALGARRTDRIQELQRRIEGAGGRALAIEVDVADERQANGFVQRTHSELGRLDVLVNNAGVMLLGPIAGAPTQEWRRMVDVNVLGVLYCTHAAIPLMRGQGEGHIVNVSSVAGRVASRGAGVYNLTKFGIGAFSESLRQELVPDRIRVTLIEPGMTATELASHNRPEVLDVVSKRYEGVTPLAAEDIAAAIIYAIAQPPGVSVNEILVRPTTQPG